MNMSEIMGRPTYVFFRFKFSILFTQKHVAHIYYLTILIVLFKPILSAYFSHKNDFLNTFNLGNNLFSPACVSIFLIFELFKKRKDAFIDASQANLFAFSNVYLFLTSEKATTEYNIIISNKHKSLHFSFESQIK